MTPRTRRKRDTYETIVRAAARSLRRRGIARSTVAEVMKSAGLTVGGFYAHFRSKESLLARAMQASAAEMWRRTMAESADLPRARRAQAVVDAYLSEQHRDEPETGCLLPATVTEVARVGQPYRSVLTAGLDSFADELGRLLDPQPTRRRRALALIALMYGGLSLSRALPRAGLSREILAAARAAGAEIIQGGGRIS
jgi:TetR/AcrR family transcriptional repressor of nem operon